MRSNMKFLIFFLFSFNFNAASADDFEQEAKALVSDLKQSLMKNLSAKITQDGPVEAIPFCHSNVGKIAKGAAKDRISKYEFGRTSHKIRNSGNTPQPWAVEYLKEFEGKKKGDIKKLFIVHKLENSKRIYIEPLYVESKCLLCHGDNIAGNINSKIKEFYPEDKATGFKLDEFRGFVWVKEK